MIDLQKALKAVCVIESVIDNEACLANATFIDPSHVLTNSHILENASSVKIIDWEGKIIHRKEKEDGGKHHENIGLDIAIIELESPAGRTYIRPNQIKNQTPDNPLPKGYLLTRYNNVAAIHEVSLNQTHTAASMAHGNKATFYTHKKMQNGYSGSAIINPEGRIVSVMSHFQRNVQNDFEGLMKELESLNIKDLRVIGIPFGGPHPDDFSKFIRNSLG